MCKKQIICCIYITFFRLQCGNRGNDRKAKVLFGLLRPMTTEKHWVSTVTPLCGQMCIWRNGDFVQ